MNGYRVLKIAKLGEKILTQKTQPVVDPKIDKIQTLLGNMMYTCIMNNGAGLSAPQVYNTSSMFVMRDYKIIKEKPECISIFISMDSLLVKDKPTELPLIAVINPQIKWKSHQLDGDFEGCLSVPNKAAYVLRAKEIHVGYTNGLGDYTEEIMDGHGARVFLHEYDHLQGICMDQQVKDGLLISVKQYMKFYNRVQSMIEAGTWQDFMKGSNIADCYWGDLNNLKPEDINYEVLINNTKEIVQKISNNNKGNIFELNDKEWIKIYDEIARRKEMEVKQEDSSQTL